jgi:hypothetical protein
MLKQRIRLSRAIFYASYNLRFFDAATADHFRNWHKAFRCTANFGRYRGIADSGKLISRRIYGFTAYSIVGILGLQSRQQPFGGAMSGLKVARC